jgi:hypothetical protein
MKSYLISQLDCIDWLYLDGGGGGWGESGADIMIYHTSQIVNGF